MKKNEFYYLFVFFCRCPEFPAKIEHYTFLFTEWSSQVRIYSTVSANGGAATYAASRYILFFVAWKPI